MPVQSEWIQYGSHTGYFARPGRAAEPMPGVLVIQEVWGVDPHIEDVTRRLAQAGYAALAPDLLAVDGVRPGPVLRERVAEVQAFMASLPPTIWSDPEARSAALAGLEPEAAGRITETHGALFAQVGRLGAFVPALRAALRHLKASAWCEGQPVACVGFCMGGGLSALLACEEPDLAGAAIFYGSAPPLDRVPDVHCPVAGFYGALDARINAGLPAFAEAMAASGKRFDYQVYPGAAHAFFNDTRPSFNLPAARDAYARLLQFFRETTGP